jgi:N-acetylglutamate synthase-like GNAT family acetyltransferase
MQEILQISKNEVPVEILLLADPEHDKIREYFDDAVYFAARHENRIVGIVALKQLDTEPVEIVNVAVEEAWRQKKVGRALLEHALSYRKKNHLRMTLRRPFPGLLASRP